jgi:PAS domain S-box-containing protein
VRTLNDTVAASVALDPDPRNVREARRVLRRALLRSGAEHLVERATVALSELITNAFVHVGTGVRVNFWSTAHGVRVEVEDGGTHAPIRRHYTDTAGTGRGLQLLQELTDRWGTDPVPGGKTVWFEIGDTDDAPSTTARTDSTASERPGDASSAGSAGTMAGPGDSLDASPVRLLHVPLLMHMAWQEHAASLLREYLLHLLDEDSTILEKHAQASDAMALLNEQVPAPVLTHEVTVMLAEGVEPNVSAEEVTLQIPVASITHFVTLDELLRDATAQAEAGTFLCPPTQPEIAEMRHWLCSEVTQQTTAHAQATPWRARTELYADVDHAVAAAHQGILVDQPGDSGPLMMSDEAGIIIAVSDAAVDLLGYTTAADLTGRRLLVVIPSRFHQAHIAGLTLHATNGRANLLGVAVPVPMVRRDGTEVSVALEVCPETVNGGHRAFVARFRPLPTRT